MTKYNINKIKQLQLQLFLKNFIHSTCNEYNIIDKNLQLRVIPQQNLLRLFIELLTSYENHKNNHIITGSEKHHDFIIHFPNFDSIKKTAQDIWNHPERYYNDLRSIDDEYYEFLKYLYIESSNFDSQLRLVDVVDADPDTAY